MNPHARRRLAPRHIMVLLLAALTVLIGACGVPEDAAPRALATVEATPTPTPPASTPSVTVTIYLLDADGNVAPAQRVLARSEVRTSDLIDELIADTSREETEQGLTTALPSGLTAFSPPDISNGRARLDFASGGLDLLEGDEQVRALAQIVWTLTSVEEIERVVINIDGAEKQWPTGQGDESRVLRRDQYAAFDPLAGDDPQGSPSPDATPG